MAITDLDRKVRRRSRATVFSSGSNRKIIIGLEPEQKIAFQLEGTRQKFRLDPETAFAFAVRLHNEKIERLAQKYKKLGMNIRSARSKAAKELKGEIS